MKTWIGWNARTYKLDNECTYKLDNECEDKLKTLAGLGHWLAWDIGWLGALLGLEHWLAWDIAWIGALVGLGYWLPWGVAWIGCCFGCLLVFGLWMDWGVVCFVGFVFGGVSTFCVVGCKIEIPFCSVEQSMHSQSFSRDDQFKMLSVKKILDWADRMTSTSVTSSTMFVVH